MEGGTFRKRKLRAQAGRPPLYPAGMAFKESAVDLSAFSTAELEALLSAANTSLLAVMQSQKYTIGSRGIERVKFKELAGFVSQLNTELTSRGADAEQVAVVDFDEQT